MAGISSSADFRFVLEISGLEARWPHRLEACVTGFGLGWFLKDYEENERWGGCFRDKKEAPLSSVVSGASGKLFGVSGKSGQALEACPLGLCFGVLDVKSAAVTANCKAICPLRPQHTGTLQCPVHTQMGGRPGGCVNDGGYSHNGS